MNADYLFWILSQSDGLHRFYAQLIGGFSRSNPNIIENNAQQKSLKSVQSVVDKNINSKKL